MAKLIAFGCSFTVGVGLPDVYPRNDTPSSMGWPALLGEKLGLEVENRGIPRGGNLEIFNNMLKADIQPDDVCVVLWSSFLRHDQFLMESEFGEGRRIEAEDFVVHTDVTDPKWINNNRNKNWLTIHHASCYLQCLGVKFCTLLGIVDVGQVTGFRPESLHIPNFIEDIRPGRWRIDEGLDGLPGIKGHPGVASQKLLSQLLYDRMK